MLNSHRDTWGGMTSRYLKKEMVLICSDTFGMYLIKILQCLHCYTHLYDVKQSSHRQEIGPFL